MFRLDDENCWDRSEKFSKTDIHLGEIYGCNFNKCIQEIEKDGKGELKIRGEIKSDETPEYVNDNNLNYPSEQIRVGFHEARNPKVEDNCSTKQHDSQDVVMKDIPSGTNAAGDVYHCKYCTEESKAGDALITPCRCSGSIGYVHKHCLEAWIRVRSEESSESEPRCELCGYRFNRKKYYKWAHFSCSDLGRSDRFLYSAGIISVFIVIGSVSGIIFCFVKGQDESKMNQLVASSVNTNEINKAMGGYNLSLLDNIKIVCVVVCAIFITLCAFFIKLCKLPPHKLLLRHVQSSERWTTLSYSASKDSLVFGNATNV